MGASTVIEWQDLLAVPFRWRGEDPATGLDCWGQAREVARRAGFELLELGRNRISANCTTDTLATLIRVPDATMIGDLLLSDPEGRGFASHVSTLVEPGWALSTSKRYGPYAYPLGRIPRELGVWRMPT